jgi:uncharacterized membrane protein YozB (DUF420 family)
LLKSKEATFGCLAGAIALFNITFYTSFLSVHLSKTYNVKDEDMGYYFSLLSVPYLLAALIFPYVFRGVPRKL